MATPKHIMIVTGEVSGDLHAARLVKAIQAIDPAVRFSGLGGQHLRACGVEIYADLTKLAVIGFVEVLAHCHQLTRLFYLFLNKARTLRPDAIILVDYPGFNLRLAARLKKLGITVIYYISPQVWAWKERRAYLVPKVTDRMMVLFDFEKKFYADRGIPVDFVGHPLVDAVTARTPKEIFCQRHGLDPARPIFGLVPGSRKKEIAALLPVMIEAAEMIHREVPGAQFLLTQAPSIKTKWITPFQQRCSFRIARVENDFYNAVNAADMCLVTSGTATLETALLEKPMVILYKTAWLTSVLARRLIKIPHIGLVNIVAGREIVPECVQERATAETVAAEALKVYQDPSLFQETKKELRAIRTRLGDHGASERAAQVVLSALEAEQLDNPTPKREPQGGAYEHSGHGR